MRIATSEHTARPWRIHDVARSFRTEDVWDLPITSGRRDDFRTVVENFVSGRPEDSPSATARFLFALRWKLGALLRWDKPDAGTNSRVHSLRSNLPADLENTPIPVGHGGSRFTPLYITDDEYAAELANSTMHGVLHLSWVPQGGGKYRARMAVLVRPNGWVGVLYMALIKPFRYLIVYPALMRQIERDWTQRGLACNPELSRRTQDPVRTRADQN